MPVCIFFLQLLLTEVKLSLSTLWLSINSLRNISPSVSAVLHVGTVRDGVVYRRPEKKELHLQKGIIIMTSAVLPRVYFYLS